MNMRVYYHDLKIYARALFLLNDSIFFMGLSLLDCIRRFFSRQKSMIRIVIFPFAVAAGEDNIVFQKPSFMISTLWYLAWSYTT